MTIWDSLIIVAVFTCAWIYARWVCGKNPSTLADVLHAYEQKVKARDR